MSVTLQPDSVLVEQSWPLGIVRDVPRNTIPPGGVYDAQDFLFDRPGMVYKRGGSEFAHTPIATTILVGVSCPEYPGDPRVLAIGSSGSTRSLYDVTTGTPAAGVGLSTLEPYENPPTVVVNDTIGTAVILTDGRGALAPKMAYLSGATVAVDTIGTDTPLAKLSCAHGSYLILANSDENPNRLWFSPIPDLDGTWDIVTAYFDFPNEITAVASVQGVFLVWSRSFCWRILGSVPPGTEGEDMSIQPLGAVGCVDARSVAQMDGQVYWAHESGIYATNGGAPACVTTRDDSLGIGSLWQEAIDGYSPQLGAVVACGVWQNDFLFVTVLHPESSPQSGATYQLLWHKTSGAWTRLSDALTADMYATANAPGMELYAAIGDADDDVCLVKLSGIFAPVAGNKADANGEAVAPTLIFRTNEGGPGLKAWGHGRLTYDMRDAASNNPTLTVAVASGVEAPSFTDAATLTETTDANRKRFNLNRDAQATTVRLTQENASAKTELYSLEIDVRPYDHPSEGV